MCYVIMTNIIFILKNIVFLPCIYDGLGKSEEYNIHIEKFINLSENDCFKAKSSNRRIN